MNTVAVHVDQLSSLLPKPSRVNPLKLFSGSYVVVPNGYVVIILDFRGDERVLWYVCLFKVADNWGGDMDNAWPVLFLLLAQDETARQAGI
jgi:hypothetical protein